MDKAFLGPIISALGRSFLSKRNQNKTSKSNVHRVGLLIIAAYGSWIASIGALILFIGNTVNSGGSSLETFIAFGVAEFLFIFFGFMFYVWYRNAYVKITRTYVLRRDLLRRVQKVYFKDVNMFRAYGNREEAGIVLFSDSSAGTGSVLVTSVQAILLYIQAQMVFRMEQERWAEADSDDDQNILRDYMRSGQAWEMVMSSGGANFSENDKKSSESSSDERN
ncbi:hypothetical protein LPB409_00920 [Rothia dentocariosa]|uniref:hypothetical protein n=1 Tax=Rothia dentocariosa TaxID=2047 RepID=UPI001C5853DF|nr:hypothetical protein [Rothia dentocariosa]QXT29478.1 hypothetical protein LPB409_00920 [Rothia dentocariosa]